MARICVIGSLNIDIMSAMKRFPALGETVFVDAFDLQVGGGKGANQAVALGRLGAQVMMVGKLGDRFYGPEYLETLAKNGVSCEAVELVPGAFPGAAFVAVDGNKDNLLFVYPGANALVDRAQIDRHWEAVSSCDVILFQLEIPMDTNRYAMKALRDAGKTIILDPAPAAPIDDDMLSWADYLTPNETELAALSGLPAGSEDEIVSASRALIRRGARTVIAKAGKRGAYVVNGEGSTAVPGFAVDTVDPTAAGDSFNAGLALALAEGKPLTEAVRFANAVAAISTTAFGAQGAMPERATVDAFLNSRARA